MPSPVTWRVPFWTDRPIFSWDLYRTQTLPSACINVDLYLLVQTTFSHISRVLWRWFRSIPCVAFCDVLSTEICSRDWLLYPIERYGGDVLDGVAIYTLFCTSGNFRAIGCIMTCLYAVTMPIRQSSIRFSARLLVLEEVALCKFRIPATALTEWLLKIPVPARFPRWIRGPVVGLQQFSHDEMYLDSSSFYT